MPIVTGKGNHTCSIRKTPFPDRYAIECDAPGIARITILITAAQLELLYESPMTTTGLDIDGKRTVRFDHSNPGEIRVVCDAPGQEAVSCRITDAQLDELYQGVRAA